MRFSSPKATYQQRLMLLASALAMVGAQLEAAEKDSLRHHPWFDENGGVGLMQTPTARFADDGEVGIGLARNYPYDNYFATIQFFPWLHTTLRYVDILNVLYDPDNAFGFNSKQSSKSRALDVKFRLLQETEYSPQVSLGLQDFLGTSQFSGEYLVLGKRWYDLDFSLGVAWGRMGNRGDLPNPLRLLNSRFSTRISDNGGGGKPSAGQWFAGKDVGLFGGVRYDTPVKDLSLMIELEGNDYQNEPFQNSQDVKLPVNVGLRYRLWGAVDLGINYERGERATMSLVFRSNLNQNKGMPKLFDPPPETVKPRSNAIKEMSKDQAQTLFQELKNEENITGYRLSVDTKRHRARLEKSGGKYPFPQTLGRTARIMANNLPKDIEFLEVTDINGGLPVSQIGVWRKDLEKAQVHRSSPEEILARAKFERGDEPDWQGEVFINENDENSTNLFIEPGYRQHMGGPEQFYFFQIYARIGMEADLGSGFSISTQIAADVINNFDNMKLKSDSALPHVRSDIQQYLKHGKTGIFSLQANQLLELPGSWYGRLSAGLLEDMFAGVGGELLYAPFNQSWAAGIDLNWVRQREYDMMFGLQDYQITTGHLSYYQQLPFYDMLAKVHAGRYLAGDKGATFDLSRRFDNGTVVGGFFTLTDVPATTFGEGSFDKGVYLSIPLDLLLPTSTNRSAGFAWRPLTRDGGQRLGISKSLYDIVTAGRNDHVTREWGKFLK
ncbi:MAG: YjbH domain-containing protein [Magnetococcales bacterium]|nr:YjbH domain-containing protein [Magnetococcales bacterium]NGZ25597.1 YjbH domain-containing protein [Magnetococcales bacterium]